MLANAFVFTWALPAKRFIAMCAACAFSAGAFAEESGPEEMFDRYAQALAAGDLSGLVALHSEDAILVPSNGGPFVQGKQAIEAYYKAIFAGSKSRQAIKTPGYRWQVYGDTAVRTSNGLFELETDEGKQQVPLRNMYVFHKEGADWKLVTTHISRRDAQTTAPGTVAPAAAASAAK